MRELKVLDHGYARLISHMKPVDEAEIRGGELCVDQWSGDLEIVRNARVSYDADWRAGDEQKDERLVNYLMKNHHTSPFEAMVFTFEIKAPIFVIRQWHRHRTWCIAGDARLHFEMPGSGRVNPMQIGDLVRKWHAPEGQGRKRATRRVADFNRSRIGGMRLRGPSGVTQVTDAWYSGAKQTYEVVTDSGSIVVSDQHEFMTPEGSARICDGLTYVMAQRRVGGRDEPAAFPVFSSGELSAERWVEFAEGYEVSDLGRVRSFFGQGRRRPGGAPRLKSQAVNSQGRAVVSVGGRPLQVSRLVASAFLGASEDFVLHKNDNPLDNRLSNLKFGSAKDNARDAEINGGRVRLRTVPSKVLGVRKAGIRDTFDISVSGDHWFVANGLVVHNSYNEVSARYTELPEEFYVPALEQITTQSGSNKQMRTAEQHPDAERCQLIINSVCSTAFAHYRNMLDAGVPRELARGILPMNTYTRMFATVDLHNLFHFLSLRLHEHAQYEIRVYAEALLNLIEPICPVAVAAFKEHRLK